MLCVGAYIEAKGGLCVVLECLAQPCRARSNNCVTKRRDAPVPVLLKPPVVVAADVVVLQAVVVVAAIVCSFVPNHHVSMKSLGQGHESPF